jgi:hypothetical protein
MIGRLNVQPLAIPEELMDDGRVQMGIQSIFAQRIVTG